MLDFWMYVLSSSDKPFGQHWLNSFPCGGAIVDGKSMNLYFIHFLKDGDFDSKGVCAEIFDMAPLNADEIARAQIGIALLTDTNIDQNLVGLNPLTAQIIYYDLLAGFDGPSIIERRAALLTKEFISFTFDQLLALRPDLWQPSIIEGIEVPNIWRCNLGPSVES
jgi:hypothetical protein